MHDSLLDTRIRRFEGPDKKVYEASRQISRVTFCMAVGSNVLKIYAKDDKKDLIAEITCSESAWTRVHFDAIIRNKRPKFLYKNQYYK